MLITQNYFLIKPISVSTLNISANNNEILQDSAWIIVQQHLAPGLRSRNAVLRDGSDLQLPHDRPPLPQLKPSDLPSHHHSSWINHHGLRYCWHSCFSLETETRAGSVRRPHVLSRPASDLHNLQWQPSQAGHR